jgi:TonB-linked SusC/RagA family outer membrane protein
MKKKKDFSPKAREKKEGRLLSFLLIIALLPGVTFTTRAGGATAPDSVTFGNRQLTVEQAFDAITDQLKYEIFYNDALDDKRVTRLPAPKMSLENVLHHLLGEAFTYKIDKQTIVISPATRENNANAQQASKSISGTVKDESGQPLPGVAVAVKGTTIGATTDREGRYLLYLPPGDKLVIRFSFMGLESQDVEYSGQVTINVVMKESVTELGDIVVTGIFNKARESYTGAATRVTEKELKNFRGQNLLSTLRNIDPSINIIVDNNLGSNPNIIPEITIRGNSSLPMSVEELNSEASKQLNAPLVIMDGFEIGIQRLMDFNDEEIASITILKDASATAIYGSRGANGVIVIATKSPQAGKLRVFVQGGVNVEIPDLTSYNLLNAREKLEVERMSGLYGTETTRWNYYTSYQRYYNANYEEVARGVDTDWLSQPLRVGLGQRYNLRMEGGGSEFRWGVGLSYNNTAGAMKDSERNALNGSITLSYSFKNVIFRNATSFDYSKGVDSKYGSFSEYARMNPYWRIRDENGELIERYVHLGQYYANPLYNARVNAFNYSKSNSITNNLAIDWKILDVLTFRAQLGLSKSFNTSDNFLPPEHTSFAEYTDENAFRKGSYTYGTGEGMNVEANATLNFSKLFADKHQLYAGLNVSLNQKESFSFTFTGEGFASDKAHYFSNALQYAEGTKPSGGESITRSVGLTGNLNYTYANRYYADFSYRVDGSSQFGSENRFAPFWSVGLGWNLHNESILKGISAITNLRLRGSYGNTGSQQFSAYQALAMFQYANDTRYLVWNGAALMGLGNNHLKWQNTRQGNVGLEVGLWDNRLSFSLDAYKKKTDNLLSQMEIPRSHGFASYTENVGTVQNVGYEGMVSGQLIRDSRQNLRWTLTAKFAYNRDKVTKLSQAMKDQVEIQKRLNVEINSLLYEGYSSKSIWAVPSLGIDPSTGDEILLDPDGQPTTTWSSLAKRYYGDAEPRLRGNVSTLFSWRNLSLNLSFAYHWGGKQYNTTLLQKVEVSSAQLIYTVDKRVYTERWQKPGDVKGFKKYNGSATKATSRFVMKDNVFEFQSASLQYRWHAAFLRENLGVEALNLSVNMSDVFYISSIKRERGIDYPFTRKISCAFSFMF